MQNRLINTLLKFIDLSDEEIKIVVESMDTRKYSKGNLLIKEGEMKSDTYYVLEGCVKQYKVIDGDFITTNFFTEGQWIVSFATPDFLPSQFNLVCIEDTTVVVGDEQRARELYKQLPHLEPISNKILENILFEYQNFMTTYITDKPEQRYLKLLKSRPDIFQRVPQYDIASYLGVKPESLSRLMKRMQQRK